MRTARRAKVVATIGPASRDEGAISRLVDAGMDVARLNMSHGTIAEHAEVVERIRRVAGTLGRPVAILLDLSGPKIRLGSLEAPVALGRGDVVTLTIADVKGRGGLLPVRYPALVEEVRPGDRLSLADGLVELEVIEVRPPAVTARVLAGGTVTSGKGVNIPGGALAMPALTAKDEADLRFGLSAGVDWVALSFVRHAEDAAGPRRVMREVGRSVPLLAKIEKPQAVAHCDAILDAFDGLMVARGDLGVEVPLEDVPAIQKDLVRRANARAKPAIVATQMLLSMVDSPRPTRAEAADVANAVLDGADALMLSEETAVGKHAAGAVATMGRIIGSAERLHLWDHHPLVESCREDLSRAIAHATWEVARLAHASLIVTPTVSGSTARRVAATRPEVPILALSTREQTVAQLALTWGVVSRPLLKTATTDELFAQCRQQALALGLVRPGDRIVVTAGLPMEVAGTTNLLRVMDT